MRVFARVRRTRGNAVIARCRRMLRRLRRLAMMPARGAIGARASASGQAALAEHRGLGIPLRRDMGKNLAERAGPSIGRQTSLSIGAGRSPLFLTVKAMPFCVHQPAVLLSWPGEWITTRSGPLLHPAQITRPRSQRRPRIPYPLVKIRFVVRRLPRCCTGSGSRWGSGGRGAALRQVGAVLRHALVGTAAGRRRLRSEWSANGHGRASIASRSLPGRNATVRATRAPNTRLDRFHDGFTILSVTWPSPGRSPSHPHPGMCAPLTAVSALHQP